jgi:hypothetical protein
LAYDAPVDSFVNGALHAVAEVVAVERVEIAGSAAVSLIA